MADNDILVLGATGTTGRRIVRLSRERGAAVRAAPRSGEVRFDWPDPATWQPAVDGASRMYLMAPHELPIDPAFVAQAVLSGVERIVLLSSRGIEVMATARRGARNPGARYRMDSPAPGFGSGVDEGAALPNGGLR